MTDQEDAFQALRELDFYTSTDLWDVHVKRLGGTTNRVFLVSGPKGQHVLRIPGKGTEAYIDRRVEAIAAHAAARAGVSPQIIAEREDGLLIFQAITNSTTMTPQLFASDKDAVARVGKVLHQLHTSGETFAFRFELFSMIDQYLKVLATKNTSVPEGYHEVLKSAETIRAALAAHPAPLAPCHCDPLAENFVNTQDKMWIIDWEYSGMNDPLWDVGDFAVEAELSPEHEAVLIASYFGRAPRPAEAGRIVIYKAMCDLLWTLWGLIQLADENPADDFWAYANRRFGRCRALMSRPEFPDHVKAVANGP